MKETAEGEDTEEEGGGVGRAGRGGGRLGMSGGGEELCRPLPERDARRELRSDWLPVLFGFCRRSGLEEEEEECRLGLVGPPKLWQCWNSSS